MKNNTKITLPHGSGGKPTHDLIKEVFLRHFSNPHLKPLGDSALLKLGNKKLAFTTDSFVVDPIFFPGGDIGSLAVYGTVNDLAVVGAKPLFISCAVIIEEGLDKSVLTKITLSMKLAAKKAGVQIVTGDTKVVEKGACDKIFINTSGIGIFETRKTLAIKNIHPGDLMVMSGYIGDHGAVILSKRKGLEFEISIKSDSAPLNLLISKLLKTKPEIRFMRDPTRGGLATTLNEIVQGRPIGIEIYERSLTFRNETRAISELLGFDPLYFPNEGAVLIVCSAKSAKSVLKTLKSHKLARNAKIIGRVTGDHPGLVTLKNDFGGSRLVEMLAGEQLPRIC